MLAEMSYPGPGLGFHSDHNSERVGSGSGFLGGSDPDPGGDSCCYLHCILTWSFIL